MIKNEPKKYVGDYNVDAVRDAYENRGRWYYFLVKEGLEQGLPLEFARDAMHEAGLFLGKSRFNGIDNLKDFADEFMTYGVEKVNEGEVVKLSEEEELVKLCYTGEKAYASVIRMKNFWRISVTSVWRWIAASRRALVCPWT